MNTKTKRRLVVVTGIIVIVLVVILAVVGSGTTAKSISIAEAATGSYTDQKIQVSGNVVENSFSTDDNDMLTFDIYDPDGDAGQTLRVMYAGGVAATFGNDVTAICTGKIGADGALHASELVTKCPSKYENASDALTIARLLEYGDSVIDKPVKVSGLVKDGTLAAAGQGDRFVLVDAEDASVEIPVKFDDALADAITDGSPLVLTGSLGADGKFAATNVAQEG